MPDVHVRYAAPDTVGRFMDSDDFVRVIVGPVGSGKSSGCIMEILRRAREQAPGPDGLRRTRFAIIRNTYPELRDTTRKTFEQWVPDALGRWHEVPFTFHMRFGDVDCEVLFRALDRPGDIKKLLSLELTGAYINEAREVPREVFEVLQTRVGRYPSKAQGGPTWFGIWGDTNPWPVGHWAHELFNTGKLPPGHAIFEQPDGLGPDAENVENLPDGYYDRLCNGKDSEWVEEYVRGKYPKRSKGSIYGDLIAAVEARGGVCDFVHEKDGIFVTFDLGISDSTAMWWWRLNAHGAVDFVDWYEASGKGISHFFDVLEERKQTHGFVYQKLLLPHDARARTLVTGTSVQDSFIERYPSLTAITPELSIEDGIGALRWLLERPVRFHDRARGGLKPLRNYRYAWDAEKQVFSKKPVHDLNSHSADAARYVAVMAKVAEMLTRKEEPKRAPPARDISSFSLDELWDTAPSAGRR